MVKVRAQKWKPQRRKNDVLRGDPIRPSIPVEQRYAHQLEQLTRELITDVNRELREWGATEHTQEYFAQDAGVTDDIRKRFKALWSKWEKIFNAKVDGIVTSFVGQSNSANEASVNASIKKLSGGLSLGPRTLDADGRQVLKAAAAENTALIKSIPEEYLRKVEGAVYRSITHPEGRDFLIKEIKKTNSVTEKRAKMIAGDQTRKVNAALTQNRLEKAGVKKFEWLHVPSSHPRELHVHMDGKIYKWDDPPVIQKSPLVRGYPAQLVNCKCQAIPVIEFED